MTRPAVAFDLFGTLCDLRALGDGLAGGADGELSARWRSHQLEISWLVTIVDGWEDFEAVSAMALDVALAESGLRIADADRDALLRSVERLPPYPDARPALDRLGGAGCLLAVLSNGTARMIESLLERGGLRERIDAVISVDEVRAYKPAAVVYRHAAERLGRPIGDVWLVSGNPFDAAGAKAAGMKVAKLERAPSFAYPFAPPPDLVAADLEQLAAGLVDSVERG